MRRPQSQLCGGRAPASVHREGAEHASLAACWVSTARSHPAARSVAAAGLLQRRRARRTSLSQPQAVVIRCRPGRADLVCAQRRVVQAPVVQIVVGAVAVPAERGQITADHRRSPWITGDPAQSTGCAPLLHGQVQRDLHPVPLRLIVAKARRRVSACARASSVSPRCVCTAGGGAPAGAAQRPE